MANRHNITFNTTAEYNTFKASANYVEPNVSYIKETNGVQYNKYDPYNGHAYVEIGGIKWATMNIGATAVTDTGLYFQWGDTSGYTAAQVGSGSGQKYFGWTDYKYTNDGGHHCSDMTKYTYEDGLYTLQESDDAARANWGGSWRMPTDEEFQALINNINYTKTDNYENSGVAGLVCTDMTDSSKVLFFPACGNAEDGSLVHVGVNGLYLASSMGYNDCDSALYFYFSSVPDLESNDRCYGYQVRGVIDE